MRHLSLNLQRSPRSFYAVVCFTMLLASAGFSADRGGWIRASNELDGVAGGPTGSACEEYHVSFQSLPPGRSCLDNYRPTTSLGLPAPFVITARSFIDQSAPHDPNASGDESLVHFHPFGLGAKPAGCVGSGGINGTTDEGNEELVFTFDAPVLKSQIAVGLNRIDFAVDQPVLFVSSTESDEFDYVITESELAAGFASAGREMGLLRFDQLTSLPRALSIDAFKLRETESKFYIHRIEQSVHCDDGNLCTIDSCDPELGCQFVFACDDGDGCTDDSCNPELGCVYLPAPDPCGDETPGCDDCNLNGIRDACDVTLGFLSDENHDGLPDECSQFGGGCGEGSPDWSCTGNWNLGGVYPNNTPPNAYSVTLDSLDNVFLDLSVSINSLRLKDEALLKMTQVGTQGDLQIVTDGGLVNEGTILTNGDRLIDLTCGPVTMRNGSYARDPSAPPGSVHSILNCETLSVFGGGNVDLDDAMTVNALYDVIIDGIGTLGCEHDGGKTSPIVGTRGVSRIVAGGNFNMSGPAGLINQSSSSLHVAGNFNNFSTAPACFDSSIGRILLNGTGVQVFEAAGEDVGAYDTGFTHDDGHTNYSIGILEITGGGPAHTVLIQNDFANFIGAGDCQEAVYAHTLVLRAGANVVLNNVSLYYGTLVNEGGTVSPIGCAEFAEVAISCLLPSQCLDGSACTHDFCEDDFCAYSPVEYGNVDGAGSALPNLDDILCAIAGFANINNCPNADLQPNCMGDNSITIDDILAVLSAFTGADPCGCVP